MAGTSTPGSLSERLRRKREEEEKRIEAERQRYEALITSELQKLGESSRSAAVNALRSIESDLEAAIGRMRALLLKAWMRPLAVGISLFLGISIGSWGLTRWQLFWIRSQAETLAGQDLEIEEQARTLAQLREGTWGIRLHEGTRGKYVVLPKGAMRLDGNDRPQLPEWTVGGQAAIKLSLP